MATFVQLRKNMTSMYALLMMSIGGYTLIEYGLYSLSMSNLAYWSEKKHSVITVSDGVQINELPRGGEFPKHRKLTVRTLPIQDRKDRKWRALHYLFEDTLEKVSTHKFEFIQVNNNIQVVVEPKCWQHITEAHPIWLIAAY